LSSLYRRLSNVTPGGATPIAAALETLKETLPELEGDTALILATDGAPNCNDALSCDADACIPNIEALRFDSGDGVVTCDDAFNCCDPALVGPGAGGNCVDARRTESLLAELLEAGVETYVVGLPGSEPSQGVLDGFALAGGTERSEATAYFPVGDSQELSDVLLDIGLAVTTDCELTLELRPPDADRVNVYFDAEPVPFDAEDGWHWQDENTIVLEGAACEQLETGDVFGIEVLAGCSTIVR
jgi:hypothetical protein